MGDPRAELTAFAEAFNAELVDARDVAKRKDAGALLVAAVNPSMGLLEARALTFVLVTRLCALELRLRQLESRQ